MGHEVTLYIFLTVWAVLLALALLSQRRALRALVREAELEPEEPTAWLDRVTTRRIIVHTTDGQTLDGLLRESTVDGLVLGAVKLVDDNPVPLAGDLFVPSGRVQMIQRPED